jgi:hypothetical protein
LTLYQAEPDQAALAINDSISAILALTGESPAATLNLLALWAITLP